MPGPAPSTRRLPRKSTGYSPVRKRMMEKDNATLAIDLAGASANNGPTGGPTTTTAASKKSRSKSIGPGGLDGIKSSNGNRRMSLAAPVPARPAPRSILKPTMPLPEIPAHKPRVNNPRASKNSDDSRSIALRTEEEQQAAAREREGKEAKEKEIKERREARRKSLANRRVSFAAEATLHTFHEVEYMHDSTTSTDSTSRRASSARSPTPPVPVETEVEEVEDRGQEREEDTMANKQMEELGPMVSGSLGFHTGEDDDNTMGGNTTMYSSDSEATDGVILETRDEDTGSDSGSDSDNSTDLVVDEITGTSVASAASARSLFADDTSDTLDDALRLASRQAHTQNLDEEEEEIIPSFGWAKKMAAVTRPVVEEEGDDEEQGMDMEMTRPMGGILNDGNTSDHGEEDEEMSMDVTKVLGGILARQAPKPNKSPTVDQESPSQGDATMEMTTALGGIRQQQQQDDDDEEDLLDLESNNGDMSMELTTAMGGLLAKDFGAAAKRKSLARQKRFSMPADEETAAMDMTTAVGQILDTREDSPKNDATMGMDMTATVGQILSPRHDATTGMDMDMDMDMTSPMGQILPPSRPADDEETMAMEMTTAIGGIMPSRAEAKKIMEDEVNDVDSSPFLPGSPPKRRMSTITNNARRASEAGSPIAPLKDLRRSLLISQSPLRRTSPRRSPAKDSPLLELGPSPVNTPPSARSTTRYSAPGRAQSPAKATPTGSARKSAAKNLFRQDPSTGVSTPTILLTAQRRALSGTGVDRSGLGSPKVAAIFDRRGSIGDSADHFVAGQHTGTRGVTFLDPRAMAQDLDESEQEQERGNDNDENSTATLKDMIASMTPKKNKNPNLFKGRKSLAVGSGRGLLGKRPAELDEEDGEDGDEERDGVKRLKNHQGSPVKNVRLGAPPSKAETTGRLAPLDFDASPRKSPGEEPPVADQDTPQETNQKMHLQDFLNLTSIRFMELTTTKRRHTQAPDTQTLTTISPADVTLESTVVAAACTVPMLELYQHSCRELKKYISEGRRIVKEIETETYDDNPALFHEYLSADPEVRGLMDAQFKNVKTHARMLSKAMWYEWRQKLQDGLMEGLGKIQEDMGADDALLARHESVLASVLPGLEERKKALEKEEAQLKAVQEELADCDPEELRVTRAELEGLDREVGGKEERIREMREVLAETEEVVRELGERKTECVEQIEEAERVREECRGWSGKEIRALRAKVDKMEKEHGWAITSIADSTITMTYRRAIELSFDMSTFPATPTTTPNITLRSLSSAPTTPEIEFLLIAIRSRILSSPPDKVPALLRTVSTAWTRACALQEDIRLLHSSFPTSVSRSDRGLEVKVIMLLVPLETKLVVTIHIEMNEEGGDEEEWLKATPSAEVVYGEMFKRDRIDEFLVGKIGVGLDAGGWCRGVLELSERLLSRGRKAG